MNEDDILKYIASNETLIQSCDNLFEGQSHIYNGTNKYLVNFSPHLFLASNITEFFKSEHIEINYHVKRKHPLLPLKVNYKYKDNYYHLLDNGRIENTHSITKLYIEFKKNKENVKYDFKYKAYYALYNEYINHRYTYVLNDPCEDILIKTCSYYIEYGYWNSMYLKCIDGLKYIASYPDLINTLRNDGNEGLKHYFDTGLHEGRLITFSPEVYILSNIDKLKDLLDTKKIKYKEAVSHYIMNGYYQNFQIDNFDHFEYLANNPKRIRFLLTNNETLIWDLSKLVKSVVANDYLINYPNIKKRKFDKIDFIKRYIGDNKINFDNNLSLNNASYYFVKAYVTHKSLRKTLTSWNKFRKFIQNRIEDILKQIPLNITKFIVQNKFL